MVNVGTGTTGTRFVKTDWPIVEGLTAGTTKLKKNPTLEPEIDLTSSDDKRGLY